MEIFEIHVLIDSDGDYAVGINLDTATEAFEANIGTVAGTRHIVINLFASLPETTELAVTAPDVQSAATASAD
jgi:hypothetical protein